jgi:hypothetical protein
MDNLHRKETVSIRNSLKSKIPRNEQVDFSTLLARYCLEVLLGGTGSPT